MKYFPLVALAVAAGISAPAMAQESETSPKAIEPYVGVLAGVHDFDNERYNGAPPVGYSGGIVEGVAGVNYNLGKFVIGGEGMVSKGFSGSIDWEYGAAGRVGFRAGKDSMFFAKAGYQWSNFKPLGKDSGDYDGTLYGVGAELSLADMGLQADRSNIRFRAQVDTRGDFHSFRPMAGIVAKF